MSKIVEIISGIRERFVVMCPDQRRRNVSEDPRLLCNRMRETIVEILGSFKSNNGSIRVKTTEPTWKGSCRIQVAALLTTAGSSAYLIGYEGSPNCFILTEGNFGDIRRRCSEDLFPDLQNGSLIREASDSDRNFYNEVLNRASKLLK